MMLMPPVVPLTDPSMRNAYPVVDTALCDGCGECLEVCVFGVLALCRNKAYVSRLETCESEAACAEVCPVHAILMV